VRKLAWLLLATACGGAGEIEREPSRLPPPTVAAPRVPPPPPPSTADGGTDAPPPRRRERLTHFPTPSFGEGDVAPGASHRFRLAVSTKAMRASASALKIGRSLSLLPAVIDAKRRTGVDPFDDGDWMLSYGPNVGAFIVNATVVRHHRTDDEITLALAQGSFEKSEHAAGGLASDLFGTDTVLLRPRTQTLAFVPQDRAKDLGAALTKLDDPGLRTGEIAKLVAMEPSKMLSGYVPSEITTSEGVVKPAADGGLDVSAEGTCATADGCKEAAKAIEATVTRLNSMIVRIATRGLLSGVKVRAEGAKVKATLHAAPEQIDAIVQLMRASLNLPTVDPVAPP